jgi:hypothetical protein
LGAQLKGPLDEASTQALADCPYHFTPDPQKMAAVHAYLSHSLGQMPSSYYDKVMLYFQTQGEWEHLGLQGVADFALRLGDEAHSQPFAACCLTLPQPLAGAFAQAFEHTPLPAAVQTALWDRIALYPEEASLLLRAFASSYPNPTLHDYLSDFLAQPQPEPECLLTIAARLWPSLTEPSVLEAYLAALFPHEALFAPIFTQLVQLPALKQALQRSLRHLPYAKALQHHWQAQLQHLPTASGSIH